MSNTPEPAPAPRPSGRRWAVLAPALLLVLGSGAAHGLLTHRWEQPNEITKDTLEGLPLTIADWDGTPLPLDPDYIPAPEDGAVLFRRYVNRVNGDAVLVYLSGGKPGPIGSAHCPDSCYPGAGYTFAAPMIKKTISTHSGSRSHDFKVATFSKTERATPMHVRVFWAWSSTGDWSTPNQPRVTFAKDRRLYKLYVIRQLARNNDPLETEPAMGFAQLMIPELEKSLFKAE
jgi:hypothetical protein